MYGDNEAIIFGAVIASFSILVPLSIQICVVFRAGHVIAHWWKSDPKDYQEKLEYHIAKRLLNRKTLE
jgi:hypothetical protein